MRQVIDFLMQEKHIKKDHILYINKEDLAFDSLQDYLDLNKYIKERFA